MSILTMSIYQDISRGCVSTDTVGMLRQFVGTVDEALSIFENNTNAKPMEEVSSSEGIPDLLHRTS